MSVAAPKQYALRIKGSNHHVARVFRSSDTGSAPKPEELAPGGIIFRRSSSSLGATEFILPVEQLETEEVGPGAPPPSSSLPFQLNTATVQLDAATRSRITVTMVVTATTPVYVQIERNDNDTDPNRPRWELRNDGPSAGGTVSLHVTAKPGDPPVALPAGVQYKVAVFVKEQKAAIAPLT